MANHADHMRPPKEKNTLAKKGADWKNALRAMKNLELELEKPVMIATESDKIFRRDLDTLGEQLLRLTTEQIDCLERIKLQRNVGCVIDGAAGTGKTVLAMELARRLCEEGKNVAMLCSNPYLSSRFQRWTETLANENGGRVVAGTPATLPLEALIANKTLRDNHQRRLIDSPELKESLKPAPLNSKWGKFIKETIPDLVQGKVSFDYLIVDEAQEFVRRCFSGFYGRFVEGRAERWALDHVR